MLFFSTRDSAMKFYMEISINITPAILGRPPSKQEEKGRFEFISLGSLNLPTLDFMKIDVEGDELNVLKGGTQPVNTCSPDLLIGIWPQNRKHILHFLTSSGYHLIKQYPGSNFLYSKNKTQKRSS